MSSEQGELIESPKAEIGVMRDPDSVLKEATKASQALMKVVALKAKPVIFNGEQYLEFEDWQTVAKFYGITARVTVTTFIDYGGVVGFEASADALRSDGAIISSADAMCLNDEDNWSTRPKYEWVDKKRTKVGDVPVPLFQLRSMAQTRACAKVLKNVLAWVVVMAGFQPTPAEEMTGNEGNSKPPLKKPLKKTQDNKIPSGDFREMDSKFPGACKRCGKSISVGEKIFFNKKLGVFCADCMTSKEENTPKEAPESSELASQAQIDSLKKLAEKAGVKLVDLCGRDGYDVGAQLSTGYVNGLMEEIATRIDGQENE